ncbi:MAG: hypothetical protein A3F15_00210 [Candidatus Wildermuthbacteria bacterium RIFCSPHIGHO2_12_FULL_40_12]|uniref:Penicillin-binding protein transpeptidase domain-containing protein n=1 Tax=Candidatus Wildermuthbacteria bacterium RIFCSPHIGHO2_12_FULL_40_12 TaxID=1802457 RepID=A0A1G2RB79_9BACT|nr:MAG: hypothetical protein A3F15_00210 [Candidatus Wildermuthbacteria bacterium RIFCSPHIGHO2_12_FULL_40_12]
MKHWRINLVLVFFSLLGIAILAKLFFIQIIENGYWTAWAQGQQKVFSQIQGNRGDIFIEDSSSINNYFPLAINKEWEFVYISPREIANSPEKIPELVEILSQMLNLEKDIVEERVQRMDSDFEMMKNKLTKDEADFFKNLDLPGIYVKSEPVRYYPRESFAAQVVGFLGGEMTGQYGIEGYYDEELKGEEGFQMGERSVWGLLRMLKKTYQEGSDIVLTLDYNIQFMAEKLLKEAGEKLSFEGAQIIVGDPHTGKIIAIAEYPDFDPNQYAKELDAEIFQNSVIQKIFEPGSVFKPITMAMALDMQKVTPQTKYVDTGSLKIGGHTIQNFARRVWGERTMTEVLERSINTGAVFVESQVGHQNFLKYVEKFGFFDKTGIDLQGEIASDSPNLRSGRDINFATASFGQGIEITPIQLFRGISVIANGGKLVKPYLVSKIINDKKIVDIKPEVENDSVISQQAANQLTTMMVNVVEKGYGKEARIPGYYIAGKTGTAQVPWSAMGIDRAGYSEKTIQSFVGFVPAFNPRFLILVKLDNPQAETAEYSAAPIFKDLAKYIIDLWQIPPDHEIE